MRNPLQEQLLKAGLAKKSKVDQVAREQVRQRHAKAPPPPDEGKAALERARLEKVEHDRALSAERNAQARALELRAQARQIVEQNRVAADGAVEYRFTDGGVIRSLLVSDAVRRQLASGSLVIASHDGAYAIIPRAAAVKVDARDPAMIVLDHARSAPTQSDAADDAWYSRFKVPDDLEW
jgi:uncharacterized protein YaiL (DUF2058 family)